MRGYIQHLQAAGKSQATIDQYTSWPRRLHRDTGTTVHTVTQQQVDAWLASHDWSPATRHVCSRALRLWFAYNGREGLRLPSPRIPAPSTHPAPTTSYWRLRLAADTGMRCCELADCTSAWLRPGPVLLVTGKGGDQRVIPVPADVAGWLRTVGEAWPGRPRNKVSLAYRRLLVDATAHSLRRRYAVRVYAACGDLERVRRLLGHTSLATTQRYLSSDPAQDRHVLEAVWAA